MNSLYAYLCCLPLLFLGGSYTEENTETNIEVLVPSEEIRLNVPNDLCGFSFASSYRYSSGYSFYHTKETVEELHLAKWDLNTKSYVKRTFDRFGPSTTKEEGPFWIDEKENFTIYEVGKDKIKRFDKSGRIIKEYSLHPEKFGYRVRVMDKPLQPVKDHFYFLNQEFVSARNPEYVQKVKLIGRIDKELTRAESIINYPEEFQGHIWSINDLEYTASFLEERIVISFYKSDYLYIYDYNGNLLERKIADWPAVDDAQPIDSQTSNFIKDGMVQAINGFYQNLIYDKYRKRFYRLVIKSNANIDRNSLKINDSSIISDKISYGIIILDEKLNVIDRYKLEDINLAPYFITKDGVYFPIEERKKGDEYVFLKMLD